jgi:hypothetical protein
MTAKIPTVIGLGRLVDFIIRDTQGQRLRVTPADDRWLAWKPDSRDLVVLRPGEGQETHTERSAAVRHEKFHGASPKLIRVMELPVLRGKIKILGLIESVTYCADGIHSPMKKSHYWVHQFGDRGEHGHGTAQLHVPSHYQERCMPRLDVDEVGNLIIVRQSGNHFTVRDWIIG